MGAVRRHPLMCWIPLLLLVIPLLIWLGYRLHARGASRETVANARGGLGPRGRAGPRELLFTGGPPSEGHPWGEAVVDGWKALIGSLLSAVWWDWFKLSRRWMPRILLVILLLMSQLSVWGAFFSYKSLHRSGAVILAATQEGHPPIAMACEGILAGSVQGLPQDSPPEAVEGLQDQCREEQAHVQSLLVQEYANFTLPGSITNALNIGLSVALILIAILATSHIGAEYGWGTVRTNLARGIGRWQYLAAKLILLALVAAGALLAIVAITAVSSLVARHLVPAVFQPAGTTAWRHTAVALGKSWVALIPYITLGAFLTVLTRSSAAGMALAIGYFLGEHVVVAVLGGFFKRSETVAGYLLGQNIDAWAGISFLGLGHTKVSATHAVLVLVAYALALAGVTFYIFERSDVAGPSAG